jgi:Fic family protein
MAYIYEKKIGNKSYFYLRISQRNGKKVISKDIAYLGNSLSGWTFEKIEKNNQAHKKEIRQAYKTIKKTLETEHFLEKAKKLKLKHFDYFPKEELLEVESCKLHYEQFLKKDSLTIKETYNDFAINFSVDSSAIEGNTIGTKEAFSLFEEGVVPKNKKLREIHEIQNNKEIFQYILDEKPEISEETIKKIHATIIKNIDNRTGYRTHDVKISQSTTKVTPFPYIKDDLEILLKWYNKQKKRMHPLALASLMHMKFEKIHPFSDGNGRVGRILIALIMLKNKYPPFIIRKRNRSEYIKAFRGQNKLDLDENKPTGPMLKFMHNEFIETYWENFLI